MSQSRREFLAVTSVGLIGAAAAKFATAQSLSDVPPGEPSAFGTGPDVGPGVSAATFAQAEKLVQFALTDSERSMASASWRKTMAALYERRTGPRKLALEATLAPATVWNPKSAVSEALANRDRFVRSASDARSLQARDEDVAFASVSQLSRWIESQQLSCERLTNIYLDRLRKFDPKLRCVITLTPDLAVAQAKRADQEIADVATYVRNSWGNSASAVTASQVAAARKTP